MLSQGLPVGLASRRKHQSPGTRQYVTLARTARYPGCPPPASRPCLTHPRCTQAPSLVITFPGRWKQGPEMRQEITRVLQSTPRLSALPLPPPLSLFFTPTLSLPLSLLSPLCLLHSLSTSVHLSLSHSILHSTSLSLLPPLCLLHSLSLSVHLPLPLSLLHSLPLSPPLSPHLSISLSLYHSTSLSHTHSLFSG